MTCRISMQKKLNQLSIKWVRASKLQGTGTSSVRNECHTGYNHTNFGLTQDINIWSDTREHAAISPDSVLQHTEFLMFNLLLTPSIVCSDYRSEELRYFAFERLIYLEKFVSRLDSMK